ncbi:Facilitated trehalose transporter Tret1 [Eumeta japonica]|uniref:Facilitated trehalose transporter Tret1 n=1 Tax=Eumeta variegata TaxID=151549 RepID=A0A4C1V691_EUMVA|nr:Facilitated trehalose transporter Tret1 [Eumeta japonica]
MKSRIRKLKAPLTGEPVRRDFYRHSEMINTRKNSQSHGSRVADRGRGAGARCLHRARPSASRAHADGSEAKSVLAWLRNVNAEDKDLEEAIRILEKEEEYAKSMQKTTWMSIVRDKTTFKAFRIALNVMLAQETCGYLVMLMYAGSIFEEASQTISLKLSPNKQTIVVGAIQLLGSMLASGIVEKTGRKWLLASTSLITGLAMLCLGGWFLLARAVGLPGWVPVLAMCVSIFADAAGFQPVPYVITSELFSFQQKTVEPSLGQLGCSTSWFARLDHVCCALSDFVQMKAYDPLLKLLGVHWVFISFSMICFLGTIYTVLWVPETKGKSLEEIYSVLNDGRQKEKRKDPENAIEDCRL